jgi:hypothetical protein
MLVDFVVSGDAWFGFCDSDGAGGLFVRVPPHAAQLCGLSPGQRVKVRAISTIPVHRADADTSPVKS